MRKQSVVAALGLVSLVSFPVFADLSMTMVGRYQSGIYGEGAAEIIDYHQKTQKAYVVNGAKNRVDIIDLSAVNTTAVKNPLTASTLSAQYLQLPQSVTLASKQIIPLGGANSLSIYNDLLAIAVANEDKQAEGVVLFYRLDSASPELFTAVEVGSLPDMVMFTPDGSKAIVANEGEPSSDYKRDPNGSISVIAIKQGKPEDTATMLGFEKFEEQKAALIADGFKFASPKNSSLAQDIEPEYITVSQDSKKAWVSLQENNALAEVDLSSLTITQIHGLGYKDLGDEKNALDVSDKDQAINIKPRQGVFSLYQPDTITSYSVDGEQYIVTANEGDARDYWFSAPNEVACINAGGLEFDEEDGCLGYSEETRAGELALSEHHPQAKNLSKAELGRLKVTTALGDENNDGVFEKLFAYGGRSFSIWNSQGEQVFDSGSDFERITADRLGSMFNSDESKNKGDSRSDDKGVEPEALAIGQVNDRTYAFIGLERMGGIFIYDITKPSEAKYIDYILNRAVEAEYKIDDSTSPVTLSGRYQQAGDLAPEGIKFVPAAYSPTKNAMLLVANEVSGTVSVYDVQSSMKH